MFLGGLYGLDIDVYFVAFTASSLTTIICPLIPKSFSISSSVTSKLARKPAKPFRTNR